MSLFKFAGSGLLITGFIFGLVFSLILGPAAMVRAGDASLTIGLISSLSGPEAAVGQSQRDGAMMAVEDLNRANGVWLRGKWQKIKIVAMDDGGDPAQTAELARKMVKDDVEIIIGGSSASTCLALNRKAGRKFLYLSVGPAPEEMFRKKTKARNTLGLTPSPLALGRGAGALAVKLVKDSPVVCLTPDDEPGREFAAGFKAGAPTGTVILRPSDQAGSAEWIKQAAEQKPGLIVLGSTGDEATGEAAAIDQAALSGSPKIMLGRGADPTAAQKPGRLIQTVWPPSLTGWSDSETANTVDAFASRFQKLFNRPADGWAAAAYGAVKEAIRAVGLANSTSARKTYRALMLNRDWKGPQGPARWRSDGRAAYKYPTWLIETGPDGTRLIGPADEKVFLRPVGELGY